MVPNPPMLWRRGEMSLNLPLSARHAAGFTVIFGALILIGRANYLLMHTLAEMFSIIVAASIFMIAWNARRFTTNSYFLFVGVGLLFVAGLDLLHTLAYKGLNIFPAADANLPTQLWISARLVSSTSLLIAPVFLHRRLHALPALAAYAALTAFLLLSIFAWRIFPACYIEGTGLTPFKISAEFVISFFYIGSLALHYLNRREFDPAVLWLMIGSISLRVVSELTFTLYVDVYDIANMLGHFLKITAFYLTYKALIESALVRPYSVFFRQIEEKTRELERSNAELDHFASVVSHDLNAPLQTITGFAELVLERNANSLDDKGKGHVKRIIDAADRMERLIKSVLSYARVTTHSQGFSNVSLQTALDIALANLGSSIEECGAEIKADELPAVLGDEMQLVQLFQNLLGNAIKYRGPEAPKIAIKAEKTGGTASQQNVWRITVADNGIGIEPRHHEQIFQIFKRVREDRSDGNGIGLAVCKKIVERHGGKIWVVSEPGKGSTFSFTIRT